LRGSSGAAGIIVSGAALIGAARWIRGKWEESDTGRQAKFYQLTAAGREPLEQETTNWNRLSGAINLVIQKA